MAYQILNPGIEHWFSPDQRAVVGYVRAGRYRIVAGAPIAAPAQLASTIAQFEAEARQAHQHVCYFGTQRRIAPFIAQTGPYAQLQIGAQPYWTPQRWPEIVQQKASLRAQIARARNKAVAVTEWPAEQATYHPALQRCQSEWLRTRGLPPMHFLVELETLGHLHDRRVFVAQRTNHVIGYLIATPIPQQQGWLFEQIVRGADSPNGITELLIDYAMRQFADEGAQSVTLGLAPLSHRGRGEQTPHPFWINLLLDGLRIYGQQFYHFDGLETFKAKLQPDIWEPVYALTRERWVGIGAFYAIATAFGGESPLRFLAHTILRKYALHRGRAISQ